MALTILDLDYDESGHALRLDCETLAKLTGETVDRLSGLFGGGIVGELKIRVDEDASLKNYLSDGANVGEAVGPTVYTERENRYDILKRQDSDDPNVAKILDAREKLADYHDTDDEGEFGFRVLERYARLFGYRWEIDQLQNYRNFASVYTITPKDREKNGTIWEYKEIFGGNVFTVDVELTSPIDGTVFSDSVSGVIGEEYALEMATELARNVVNQIRQHVRESNKR
jgi:hypothetical protein